MSEGVGVHGILRDDKLSPAPRTLLCLLSLCLPVPSLLPAITDLHLLLAVKLDIQPCWNSV